MTDNDDPTQPPPTDPPTEGPPTEPRPEPPAEPPADQRVEPPKHRRAEGPPTHPRIELTVPLRVESPAEGPHGEGPPAEASSAEGTPTGGPAEGAGAEGAGAEEPPAGEPRREGARRARGRAGERRREPELLDRVVRVLGFRYAMAALVLVAVLALYGVAALSRPDGGVATRSGAETPVTSAVLACPAPGESRLSALTPPPSKGTGRADVLVTEDGAGVASITTPGTNWTRDVQRAPSSYTVRAKGALAVGLTAERTTHAAKGDDRGLAATRCTEPGTDLRFLGPGPLGAKDIELYLTNVDAQLATVDVTALSGEGPLDTADGRGTPVEPYTTKVVRIGETAEGLGQIVETAQIMALRVRATTGRVAAAVRVRVDKRKGVDWLPVAIAPTTSLVVPGIPSGPGGRRLLIAVPGTADARIKVQVMTSTGAFAPEGQDTLDAPAETVTPLDLERALSGKAAAVRLIADRPIVAGFAAERGEDVGFGAATTALPAAGGVVADNRFDSSVVLTAPDGAATVRLTTVTARGATGTPQDVKIPAGRTAEVKLTAPSGTDGFGLLIVAQPGSGTVYAARVMSTGRDGRLFTVLPVTPAVTTVRLPPVADSHRSLVPG